MKRILIITVIAAAFLFAFLTSRGQVKNKAFAFVLKRMLSHKVPEISVAKAASLAGTYTFLDAREPEEFTTSHLENAVFIGYKKLDEAVLSQVDKHKPLIVYCSVGKRSENIALKLKKEGYTNVCNLYGGIFEWVNQGHPVYDVKNKPTDKVHAYNLMWGRFLEKGKKVY